MKKNVLNSIIIIIIIVLLLFVTILFFNLNYRKIPVNSVNNEKNIGENLNSNFVNVVIEKTSQNTYCNEPLILNEKRKDSCCMDNNANNVCDVYEENKNDKDDILTIIEGCGDGICTFEERDNCCMDCGCKKDYVCTIDNECVQINIEENNGNNEFEESEGQNNIMKINFSYLLKYNVSLNNTKENETFEEEKINITLKPLSELEMFEKENIPLKEYLIVYFTKIYSSDNDGLKCIRILNKKKCYPDTESELMFYTQAYTGLEEDYTNQKLIYPLGRAKSVSNFHSFIKNPMPIFSILTEELENKNDIKIKFLLSDSDKKTVLQKINYDTTIDEVKNIFSNKNDLIIDNNIILKKSENYNLGFHEEYEGISYYSYMVRKLYVPENIHLKVKLKEAKVYSYTFLDTDDKPDLILWYRIADNFIADEFGTSTEYDTHQTAGSRLIQDKGGTFNNNILYETDDLGPFLFIELNLYDRDSSCKNLEDSPYVCANTDRLEEAVNGNIIFLSDSEELLQKPKEKITIEKELKTFYGDIVVEIIREPIIQT